MSRDQVDVVSVLVPQGGAGCHDGCTLAKRQNFCKKVQSELFHLP